jgi:hypothetical protein
VSRSTRIVLAAAFIAVAAVAAAASHTRSSSATFTTSSDCSITASVDTAGNWLHVYSESTDPQLETGYARRRLVGGGEGDPAAAGQDADLSVDLGDFPDKNTMFSFDRVFSILTPDAFPDGSVSQIAVTLALLPDPTTGDLPLQNGTLTPFGSTSRGSTTVTLGPATKYQFNVRVKVRKKFELGQTYFPRVRLSLTVSGVAGAFTYEFPLGVTDAGG